MAAAAQDGPPGKPPSEAAAVQPGPVAGPDPLSRRQGRPPPREPPRADLGVVQIPVDPKRRIPFRKSGPATPTASAAPSAAKPASPPPPPCPTQLPFEGPLPPIKTVSVVKDFGNVAWHICATDLGRKGLWIGPIELRRSPSEPWIGVISQAGLADIFVPYHVSGAFRSYQLQTTTALSPISLQDVGTQGGRLWFSNETFPTLAYELRDRGIAWMCKGGFSSGTGRGQEFVLWAHSDAGNDDNIIEYSFRDDGSIGFRLGTSGYNLVGRQDEPHTHNALWYVDIDLNGASGDRPWRLPHWEPAGSLTADPLVAWDHPEFLHNEGSLALDPARLDAVLIEDITGNAFGNRLGYRVAPLENAQTRHFGPRESWTAKDVHVTRYHTPDLAWASPIAAWSSPEDYLLDALNGEATANQDLVLWVKTASHHHPTDEERVPSDLMAIFTPGMNGISLVRWSGFEMKPYNLFTANPLGAPVRCGP
ncbi:MAG TPA: hypothetical protein VEA61_12395 [Allosphingosinicella sp.]|nr:hypothetical protein [Allosphingosinicella sp.]